MDILTMGELLIDLTPAGNSANGVQLLAQNPGGAPANVAVCAAKLGSSAGFAGKVGNDGFGKFLIKTLNDNNVDTTGVSVDNEIPTTLAVVSLDENWERSFAFYRKPGADIMLEQHEVNQRILHEPNIFHFGSVSLTDDPCRSTVLTCAKYCKSIGKIISYDPNYRESLWSSKEEALHRMKEGLSLCHICKVSEEELFMLTNESNIEKAADILGENIPWLFVTLGDKGAYYCAGNNKGFVNGYKCTVADTNGAGDTFTGAVLSQISKAKPDDLIKYTDEQIRAIVDFACGAAACTVSKSGAIPAMPTIDDINNIKTAEVQ